MGINKNLSERNANAGPALIFAYEFLIGSFLPSIYLYKFISSFFFLLAILSWRFTGLTSYLVDFDDRGFFSLRSCGRWFAAASGKGIDLVLKSWVSR